MEFTCCEAPELRGGGMCSSSSAQVPAEVKSIILQRSGSLGYMPRRNHAGYVRGNALSADRAWQKAAVRATLPWPED